MDFLQKWIKDITYLTIEEWTNLPTKEEKEKYLRDNLPDPRWRIFSWFIYKIKDKETWDITPFKPNNVQKHFYDNMAKKNIILKWRQLWFTTFLDLIWIDFAIWNPDKVVWILAQTDKLTKDILETKVKLVYVNIAEWVKQLNNLSWFKEENDNSKEIIFSNRSKVYVDTSFRSSTLHFLHISEYAKICAVDPMKADEIKRWALNTVHKNNYVFIESTAEGASGIFYNMCKKSMDYTWPDDDMVYKFHFYPWYLDEWYINKNPLHVLRQDILKYFKKLEEDEYVLTNYPWLKFTEDQMRWYQLKQMEQDVDMAKEYPWTPKEAFNVAIEGAFFENELRFLRTNQRLCKVKYDPNLDVNTAWDLWINDDMTIVFWQQYWKEIRIIDFWESKWSGIWLISILTQIVLKKCDSLWNPYNYWKHFFPHDIMVRNMETAKTRYSTVQKYLKNIEVLKRLPIEDSISLSKRLFFQMYFDESNSISLVEHLWQYIRKFDKVNQQFLNIPAENGHQHASDAFRYMCQAYRWSYKSEMVVTESNYWLWLWNNDNNNFLDYFNEKDPNRNNFINENSSNSWENMYNIIEEYDNFLNN